MHRLSLAKRHLMKCGKKSENENCFLNNINRSKQAFKVDFALTKSLF